MIKLDKNSAATKALVAGLATAVTLTGLHLMLKYISVVVFNEKHGFMFEFSNRFDMNDENSLPQWVSQSSFLIGGGLAFLAAYLADKKPVKRLWLLIGAVLMFLSFDDASAFHEFTLQTIHNELFVDTAPTILRNAWLFIAPFVGLGLIWLFAKMLKFFPKRTAVCLTAGAAIFFIGALIIDSLANSVPGRSYAGQGVFGAVEGGLQLVGISIIIYSIVDYLEFKHKKQIVAAIKQLKSKAP